VTENDLETIKKFAKTSIWDFKRALEVALSEIGIVDVVTGVYDLKSSFLIAVADEQIKAEKYLNSIFLEQCI